MAEPTDHELLTRFARTADEAAFAALVTRHVNLVWSAARRFTGDDTLASEVTQAVFIILAQKAGRLSAKTVVTGWLYQTARLTAANALKENRRRQHREHQAYMESTLNRGGDASSPTANESIWQQLAPVLDEAMHALRTADRDAVLLRFFENKSLADVGAALGVSEDAARVRVNRALDKLRAKLGKAGVTLGPTIIASTVATNSVQAAPAALAAKVSVIAAKGAVVSGPTLAIVKGTINFMTWAKLKFYTVFGTAVVIAVVAAAAIWKDLDPEKILGASSMLIVQPTQYSNSPGIFRGMPSGYGGQMTGRGVDIKTLIECAYGINFTRRIFPTNLPSEKFDFIVTISDHPNKKLQEEIKRQFRLIERPETREEDVLLLKKKDGSVPKPIRGATIEFRSMPKLLVECEQVIGLPIIDRTGTNPPSSFSFWLPIYRNYANADLAREELKKALLDQLGLELVPSREQVEMLVVEKVK